MRRVIGTALVLLSGGLTLAPDPAGAAFPGNNGSILFTSLRSGNGDIYLTPPGGSSALNVTNNAAVDRSATWYPNGTRIAFRTNRDGNDEVYAMNADGSSAVNLTKHADFD